MIDVLCISPISRSTAVRSSIVAITTADHALLLIRVTPIFLMAFFFTSLDISSIECTRQDHHSHLHLFDPVQHHIFAALQLDVDVLGKPLILTLGREIGLMLTYPIVLVKETRSRPPLLFASGYKL